MVDVSNYLSNYLNSSKAGLAAADAVDAADPTLQPLFDQGYATGAGADVGILPTAAPSTGNPTRDAIMRSAGRSAYGANVGAVRTPEDIVRDAGLDITGAVGQSALGMDGLIGGAASKVIGLFDKNAGDKVGEVSTEMFGGASNAFQSFLDNKKSEGVRRTSDAYHARSALTQERNRVLQQDEVARGDSPFMAGLRRWGRDVVDYGHNADVTTLGSGIAQGVGSFVVGGLAGKALAGLGLGEKVAMAISIGAQEGAGAHQQTSNAVLSMSHDELMANSPQYREQLDAGKTPEEARADVANDAGLLAAAVAAPVGAATGALFSAGEHNLFRVGSIRAGIAKPFVEGGEELLQSTAGQYGQNMGVHAFANENQDMLAGVGEAGGQGALAGFGTGAVFGAPGTTVQLAAAAGKTVWQGVTKSADAVRQTITDRAAGVQSALDASSPVSAENAGKAFAETAATVADPATRAEVEAAATEHTSSPENAQKIVAHYDKLTEMMKLDPSEADNEASPVVSQALRESSDKFDAMRRVAAIAGDEKQSLANRAEAGLYLHNAQIDNQALIGHLNDTVEITPSDDDPRLAPLRTMEDTVLSLHQVPEIQHAMALAMKLFGEIKPEAVTAENLRTPDGQAAVRATVGAAQLDPTSVNGETAKSILANAKTAGIDLSEQQITALKVASEILDAAANHTATVKERGLEKKSIDAVSGEIRSDSIESKKQWSASQHMKAIMTAMATGDLETAKHSMENFMGFAEHMRNKVEALNKHLDAQNKEGQYYQSRTGSGEFEQSPTPLKVHTHDANSIKFAQSVASDAKIVGLMANIMATNYPQLGVEPLKEIKLDSRLSGKPQEIAYKFRKAAADGRTIDKAPVTEAPVAKASVVEVPAVKRQGQAEPPLELTNVVKPVSTLTPVQTVTEAIDNREETKADYIKIGEQMEKLSPDEHAEVLAKIGDYTNVKPVTGNVLARITDAFAAITKSIGVDLSPLAKQIFLRDGEADEAATYHFMGNSISITRDFMRSIKGDVTQIARVLSHEIGHALDWYSSEDGLASNDEMFNQDGELYKEFLGLKENGVLPDTVDKPLWSYIDRSFKHSNEEFFAELHSFVALNPQLAQELIPNGAKTINEIIDEVAQARKLNIDDGARRAANERAGSSTGQSEAQAQNAQEPIASTPEPAPVEKPVEKIAELTPTLAAEPVAEISHTDAPASQDPLGALIENPAAGVNNWFKKSFSLVPDASRIMSLGDNALAQIKSALKSTSAFIAFAGSKSLTGSIDASVSNAYSSILGSVDTIMGHMDDRLNAFLAEQVGTNAPTFREALLNGGTQRTVNDMMRSKVINILDQNGEELGYNKALQRTAVLAGLQWLIGQAQSGRNLDDDGVFKLLGVRSEEQILDDFATVKARFNEGLDQKFSLQAMGQIISRFWGTKDTNNSYIGFTQGIPNAMAAEVMAAFEKAGLIKTYPETVAVLVGGKAIEKDYNRIAVTAPKETLGTARQKPDLIERLAVTDPEVIFHIGTPPSRISDTQLRNRAVKNTAQQLATIEHHQNTPYKPNVLMHVFYEAIGDKLAVALHGSDKIDEKTNVNHAKSLEGKNLSVLSSLETMREMMAGIQNYADANNMTPAEVSSYYRFEMTKAGRLQMVGKNNPQGSKVMRSLLLPTNSVTDLTDPEAYGVFMLAVAQHLGEKVHKISRAQVISNIEAKLGDGGELAPALELMHEWVTSQDSKKPLKLDRTDMQLLTDTLGEEVDPVAIHALMDVARYLNAKEAGPEALSKFESSLYVEADGVTDGPINAMMLFGMGRDAQGEAQPWFTPKWLQMMAKGGMFLGAKQMSISDYMQSGELGAAADAYEATTEKFRSLRHDLIAKASPEVKQMSRHLLTLMTELNAKDIRYEDGKLVIERGIAKNPLTVTIYGSGARGISNKFVRLLTQELYRKMSEGGLSKEAQTALKALTQTAVVNTKKQGMILFATKAETFRTVNGDPTTATMTASMIETLGKNLGSMFVAPLQAAIDQTIGDVFPAVSSAQRATQVQSIILSDLFKKRVEALLADKKANDPNWKASYSLTKGELAGIRAELAKLSPQIMTGTQSFDMSGSESTDLGGEVARGLNDSKGSNKFATSLNLPGPVNAGVRATSTLVQGSGDGQMMQNFATDPGAEDALPVFDGINFGLNNVESGSQRINKAVFNAWMRNPLGDVHTSYAAFMKNMTPEIYAGLSENSKIDLARSFEIAPEDLTDLKTRMELLQEHIGTMAEHLDARHTVLGRIAMSVDHMASAESPHINEGIELVGSPEEQAKQLNDLLTQELEKRGQKAPPRTAGIDLSDAANDIAGFQSAAFGTNDRLTRLRQGFENRLTQHLQKFTGVDAVREETRSMEASVKAYDVSESMIAAGFNMNMQERSTFDMLVHVLATEAHLDPNALARMNDLWSHVTGLLKPKDFMVDPEALEANDVRQAQDKLNALLGSFGTQVDEQGRTSLLPAFMALTMVNEPLRAVLREMALPKSEKNSGRTLDGVLENYGTSAMDRLDNLMSGEGKAQNVREAIDNLTDRVAANKADQESFIAYNVTAATQGVNSFNQWTVDKMNELALFSKGKLEAAKVTATHPAAKLLLALGTALTDIVNEERAGQLTQSLMSMANRSKMPKMLFDFFNEVAGRTEDNAPIYDMIKLVRSLVQRVRQQFRIDLPKTIAKQFTRKLTSPEWTSMHDGMAKTDLAALHNGNMSVSRIMEVMTDSAAHAAEVARIEEIVRTTAGRDFPLIEQKIKELARFMITGDASSTTGNFLRNAEAIARLLNETSHSTSATPSVGYVQAIDQLTTLKAMDLVKSPTKATLANLLANEKAGVEFTLTSLIGQAAGERSKFALNAKAKLNHYKGHVPTEQQAGASMIVAPDSDSAQLRRLGYIRAGDYKGTRAEGSSVRLGYYYAPVSGRAAFHQGILQNVRQTAYGVDPRTGFTLGRLVAGRITEPRLVADISRRLRLNQNIQEALLPIFNERGKVVAYERSVDPVQEAKLQPNTHMGEVMGIWRGRQMEEILSQAMNSQLISRLSSKWEAEKASRKDEYVNLFSQASLNDPIIGDAVKLITPEAKAQIQEHFNPGEFWVRRDQLDDVVGFRGVSVGDSWTGTTNLKPEHQKVMRDVATAVFGVDAYKYLVKTEKTWQNFVGDARVTIVVKSVIVPVANIMANVMHKLSLGIPAPYIAKGMLRKTAEATTYLRNEHRKTELDALLFNAKAKNDLVGMRKAEIAIQSIEDAHRRLSIWPLIEAGEFNSITEAGIHPDDQKIIGGRLNDYMERAADKLPDSVKTAGRYAIVSQDTALFKGLAKATHYGDFLSKAVLYDWLTKEKGQSPEKALGRVSEEFINFDRTAGRGRTYLESMGLLWFWHFKIRAIKVGMATLRNNPLQLLMTSMVPLPTVFGSIGSPLTDNLGSVALNHKLGWSIGPWQAFRAYLLNPGFNMFT